MPRYSISYDPIMLTLEGSYDRTPRYDLSGPDAIPVAGAGIPYRFHFVSLPNRL